MEYSNTTTTAAGNPRAIRLRVCFALPRLLPNESGILVGGSANAAMTLGKALSKRGVRVEILAPVPADCAPALAKHAAGSLVSPLVYPKAGSLRLDEGIRSLWLLLRAVRRHGGRYDVIHVHSGSFPYSVVPLLAPGHPARIQSLYCPLGDKGDVYRSWWDRASLARQILGRMDAIVAVSDNVRRSLEAAGIPNGGVTVLPMCVDTDRFFPRPPDGSAGYFSGGCRGRRVLFVGNASRQKGLRILVEAIRLLARSGVRPSVVATLENANAVEDFDRELGAVRQRLAAWGLADQVRFLGLVPDMPALYAESDVVVIPWVSTKGPSDLPMVALEAMAMGKCVVSTPVGGCRELLREGGAGLLTDDFTPESLARILKDAIESKELRHRASETAGRVVGEFSGDALAWKMIGLYQELLDRKGRFSR